MTATAAVTGAFGYSGSYITRRLLDRGVQVRTLTNSPQRRNPFGAALKVFPLCFRDRDRLSASLRGVNVLYNTYWVRFNHHDFNHSEAVSNTLALFDAARRAGVGRIVHVSITNPSLESPLEYFSGKARLEKALKESGMSWAILRPTVLFGKEDILINNIAWVLRRFPLIFVFGDGSCRLQPIYVDDLAGLAVELGAARENRIVNAIGPETFTFRSLVETIGRSIGKARRIVGAPPGLCYLAARAISAVTRDPLVTREEITGLMADLLYVDSAPTGTMKLTDWVRDHALDLGGRYASELARRRDRQRAYAAHP